MTLEEIALQIATAQVGASGTHTTDATVIEWRRHAPGRYGIRDAYAETEYVVEHIPATVYRHSHWERIPLDHRDGESGLRFAHRTAQDALRAAMQIIQSPYELGIKTPNFAPGEVA